ncbi:MAG: aldo/keto reductase [bacterium]|nr:aldo/keto reductase [bacterium]
MKNSKTDKSRRRFLKQGAASIAGITLLPGGSRAMAPGDKSADNPSFVYRTLGKTGLKLPVVSMGAANTNNANLAKAALDAGIRYLDTGHYYSQGRNEEMLGNVLKDRPRNSYVLSTKVMADHEDQKTGQITSKADPAVFVKKFETSLKRLQLNEVDIFYLHNVGSRESVLYEPILSAMVKLKKQGKVRFIGVSTHVNEPETIRAAIESKVHDIVLTAYNFRQPHKLEVKKAIAEAAKAGLGIVAMKTQAGVFWDRKRKQPINMKAALKWALQDENVHTAIPGFTTFEQMEADLSVMKNMTLSQDEIKDLKLDQKTMGGLFCPQCGSCLSQCRNNLDIPTVMRCYMYLYGYRQPAKSKDILTDMDVKRITCRECESCRVDCKMGFDVPGKIKDVTRLLDVPGEFLS